MADTWKAGEKKGMLSTSNRVISPQDEKRERENNWRGGGRGGRLTVVGYWQWRAGLCSCRCLLTTAEEAMMMNSGRPGKAAADYSPEGRARPPARHDL